jgi:hypothetical protein
MIGRGTAFLSDGAGNAGGYGRMNARSRQLF